MAAKKSTKRFSLKFILLFILLPITVIAALTALSLAPRAAEPQFLLMDSTLSPTPMAATNRLKNPGFELDTNSDGRPDDWNTSQYSTRSNLQKLSGSYSMRHLSASNSTYTVTQTVNNIVPGKQYTVQGNVLPLYTNDDGSLSFEVRWRTSANEIISTIQISRFNSNVNYGTGWKFFRNATVLTAPASSANAQFIMRVRNLNSQFYVDDVAFFEGSVTTLLTPQPTVPPRLTIVQNTPLPTPIAIGSGISYDLVAPDETTNGNWKRMVINGPIMYTQYGSNGVWSQATVKESIENVYNIGLDDIRSFSQSKTPTGRAKQDYVSADGKILYSRVYTNGAWPTLWTHTYVRDIIPGVSDISSFDQSNGDVATGNRLKQTAVSYDGTMLYTRFFLNTGYWETTWSIVYVSCGGSTQCLGIPGVTRIKTFSQAINLNQVPEQTVLSRDGTTLYTRTYTNNAWSSWTSKTVSSLGMR